MRRLVIPLLLALSASAHAASSHVYVNSNESANKVIHYARMADGKLKEVERVATGKKGLGGFQPISGKKSVPDELVSDGALRLSADHQWLFVANGGDKSVSSFKVGADGALTLIDSKVTGTETPNSLAFNEKTGTLYVSHLFGPGHIKTFKVADGVMTETGHDYTLNYGPFQNRLATQILISPDRKFVVSTILYNDAPRDKDGKLTKAVKSNTDGGDGLMVFPVKANGELGEGRITQAGGSAPFASRFLRNGSNQFVTTFDGANGLNLNTLNADGSITNSPVAKVALYNSKGASGVCWVAVSPDNKFAYSANYDSGLLASFKVTKDTVELRYDGLGKIMTKGKFDVAQGEVVNGPLGSWGSPDGYLYQLYPNASKLVAFKMDGPELVRVADYPIPLNSPQGIDGF